MADAEATWTEGGDDQDEPRDVLAAWRAKYPGENGEPGPYDDVPDTDLARAIQKKFPGAYDDDLKPYLPQPPAPKTWIDSFNEGMSKVMRIPGDVSDMVGNAISLPGQLIGKGAQKLEEALPEGSQERDTVHKFLHPSLAAGVQQSYPNIEKSWQEGGLGLAGSAGLGVLKTVDGMLTPEGLGTIAALMVAPEGILPIVSAYFAKQMASGAWDKWPEMKQAAENGDWSAFTRAAAQSGTEGLMALMATRHAIESAKGWIPEKGAADQGFDLKKANAKIQKDYDDKQALAAQITQSDPAKIPGPSSALGARFEPTMAEREQVRRLAEANGGVISTEQVPEGIVKKIQQNQWLQGGTGGWNDPDAIDRTMKYFFKQGITKDDLASIIGRGLSNELSPEEAKIFDYALEKVAPQQQRGVTAASIQKYLTDNAFATRVVTPRERVMALGREQLRPLDPAELPDLEESGKSRIAAVGLNGEPVDRLNPPDTSLQQTLGAHLETIFGKDPAAIAQGLAGLYGVKEPISLNFDDSAYDTPSTVQNEDGSWTVTVPPDATPYEVAHEIGMHVAGWDDEGFSHDNNKVAGRIISDLETAGQTRYYDNRLPKWGTVAADVTAPGGDTATWRLGAGDGEDKTAIPYMRHIYDPHGVLHPLNLVRDYPLGGDIGKLVAWATDKNDARGAIGSYLRQQGFDGYVWPDPNGDWHVSSTPIGDKFLEGGPRTNEYNFPKDGAPDSARMFKNMSLMERFGQIASRIPQELVAELEKTTVGKNLTGVITKNLMPALKVPDEYMAALNRGLTPGRMMMMDFLRQADLAKRSQFFDRRPDNENVQFIKDLQLGFFRRGEYRDYMTEDSELGEHARHLMNWEDHFYDAATDALKRTGMEHMIPFLEDHLTNIWKEPDAMDKLRAREIAVGRSTTQRPMEGPADFLRRRVYETLEDGMNAGLSPANTNPYVIQQLRGMQVARFISALDMMRESREAGSVQLIPDARQAEFQKSHPGWIKVDDQISQRYFPTQEGPFKAGSYFMEPNVAQLFKNYTSHNMLSDIYAGRTMAAAKNGLTALELGFSGFHAGVVTLEHFASGIGRAARSFNTEGASGVQELKNTIKDYWRAMQPRAAGGESIVDMVNSLSADERAAVAKSGLSNLMQGVVPRGATFETVRAALNSNQPGLAMIRTVPALAEFVMRPLFQQVIPQIKLLGFQRELAMALKENAEGLADGRIDPDSVMQTARRRMEDRLGQMNWDNLWWDKTVSGVFKLALRSTTWKLGSMRAVGGAVGALGKRSGAIDALRQAPEQLSSAMIPEQQDPIQTAQAIAGGKTPEPTFLKSRLGADVGWLLGTLTVNALTAALYQQVMTGKSPGQTPAGTHDPELALDDLTSPRMGGKDAWGHDARANMPSYVREMRSAGMATKDALNGQFGKAAAYMQHSTSALFGRLMESIANKDYYGNQIYDRNDPVTSAVGRFIAHLVPLPIAFQSAQQPGMTPANAMGGFMGFTRASSRYQMTDFESWLSDEAAHRYAGLPGKEPSQTAAVQPPPKTVTDRIKKTSAFNLAMYGWDKMSPDEQQKYGQVIWKKMGDQHFLNNLQAKSRGKDNGGEYAAFMKKREQIMDQLRGATLSGSQ